MGRLALMTEDDKDRLFGCQVHRNADMLALYGPTGGRADGASFGIEEFRFSSCGEKACYCVNCLGGLIGHEEDIRIVAAAIDPGQVFG